MVQYNKALNTEPTWGTPSVSANFIKLAIKSPAGGGKDWLYTQLNDKANPNIWCRIAFADPMKEMAHIMTGLSLTEIESVKGGTITDEIRAKLPPSIRRETDEAMKLKMRRVLQYTGTELGRNLWATENWVHNALTRIAAIEASDVSGFYDGVIITDMRFQNEFDALEQNGFLLVHLDCPVEYQHIKPGTPAYDHASERDLDGYIKNKRFHLTLYNDRKTPADVLVRAIEDAWAAHVHNLEEARKT